MKRVLIAEDDIFISDLTSAKLHAAGYTVDTVTSGEEVLDVLDRQGIDVVILDLELTGLQGIDVLGKMKEWDQAKRVPVIVFSNNDEPNIKEQCLALGADAFFVKINTDFNTLIEKVNEVISS